MSKEFSIEKEGERKKAEKDMEELSELSDEDFEKKKKETIEELGIPEDRAEGFLKSQKDFRKSKGE